MGKGSASSVDWLRAEYINRKRKNPSYSLRAFARQLCLPSGALSEILSLKRPMTQKLALRLVDRLNLSAEARSRFLYLVSKERASDSLVRKMGVQAPVDDNYQKLSEDRFNLIAEWYHFALMALLETEGCVQEPLWLARRLGISVVEVRNALERCMRLGLIEDRAGSWVPTGNLTTTHDVPSAALRRFHKQNLKRTSEMIESRTVSQRDISSITMAIDPEKLGLAKQVIQRFRRQMATLLENGSKKEVYTLSILLMPVTQQETNRDC